MADADLAAALRDARARSTRITQDLVGDRLLGPKIRIVNPPLWEIGHVAWFQEHWCLRRRPDGTLAESILPGADALYDSAKVHHDTRWNLPLPDIEATRRYGADVLERVLRRLEKEPENASLRYFTQLATLHEDMHAEAFHYTRQTLGYTDPLPAAEATVPREPVSGDADLAGGTFLPGATPADGFVFDNEKWAHEVQVAPFRISRTAVNNAGFLAFVEADGYSRREWWSEDGWAWRSASGREAPVYWTKSDGAWWLRRFDKLAALPGDVPVVHVNWHEAEAWCRYANRRLPTEAEWEYAAAGERKRRYPWGEDAPSAQANLESDAPVPVDAFASGDTPEGCRQMMGNVWEWTGSTFAPYPGFVIDPYKEYSEPWFGTHKVLRGGSFASTRRLLRNTWRNFYTPDRADIFAGFRTCAIS